MKVAITILLASVWGVSGLYAKLFDKVPRHRRIVARFFGDAYAPLLTRLIGVAEMLIAVWIVSGVHRDWCFVAQLVSIVSMNTLELWRARDLLLFPRLMPIANAVLMFLAYLWSQA